MLPINNFYTGEGSGVLIPELGKTEAAVTRAQEGARRLQETKFADALRKREEMIKVGAVTPVDIIHEKITAEQALMIDGFQKKLQDTYAKYHGDIPTDVMLGIISERNEIEGWQKQVLAKEKIFLQDAAEFNKNGYDYIPEVWAEAQARYYDTGEYTQGSGLNRIPIDTVGEFLSTLQSKASGLDAYKVVTELPPDEEGNKRTSSRIDYSKISNDQIAGLSKRLLMTGKGYLDTVKKDFDAFMKDPSVSNDEKNKLLNDAAMRGENPAAYFDYQRNLAAVRAMGKEADTTKRGEIVVRGNGVYAGDDLVLNLDQTINSMFIKGEKGVAFNEAGARKSSSEISSSEFRPANNVGLSSDALGQLPPTVFAYPIYATAETVEFKVDNSGKNIKEYKAGADGRPVKTQYTSKDDMTQAAKSGWIFEDVSGDIMQKILKASGQDLSAEQWSELLKQEYFVYKTPDYIIVKGSTNSPALKDKLRSIYKDIDTALPKKAVSPVYNIGDDAYGEWLKKRQGTSTNVKGSLGTPIPKIN